MTIIGAKVSLHRGARRTPPRRTNRRIHSNMAAGRVAAPQPGFVVLQNLQRTKVIAGILALVLGGILFEFFNADTFYVFGLETNGLRYLTNAEVEHASGIDGYSIFFVDARKVERAVLKLPEVRAARVTAGLPNRVVVEIDERQPEITWQRGAESYWVDRDGIVFRARVNLTQLITIRDLDQTIVKPGQPARPDAINAYRALRAFLADGPRAFEWSAARGLAYTDEHGWKIYLGGANEMAGKLAKLDALVPQLVSRNAQIKFIDLSKGDPFYQ